MKTVTNNGRPANKKALKIVSKLTKKNRLLSNRMIATLMEKEFGKKPDPKSVWRWRQMVK